MTHRLYQLHRIVVTFRLSFDNPCAPNSNLLEQPLVFIGFTLGYWGARGAGLNESDSRTASIEVGLQNAGMASGLAISVLHSTDAGLAAAIFGPWMNAAGSVLASYWRQKPTR